MEDIIQLVILNPNEKQFKGLCKTFHYGMITTVHIANGDYQIYTNFDTVGGSFWCSEYFLNSPTFSTFLV